VREWSVMSVFSIVVTAFWTDETGAGETVISSRLGRFASRFSIHTWTQDYKLE
jgi:hypothetical protein